MSKMPKTFGQRLKAMRESSGMTQSQLAASVGTSKQHFQKWEYGTIKSPMYKMLVKLAAALECTVDELVTG